ncbi:MAG: electron transport complex subunit RsxC [Candidatus Omnitrophota bacterium]
MIKTFPQGGVHPHDNKLSAGSPIARLSLPKTVFIPVAQHIGSPAVAVVKAGDKVKTGQVIAQGAGFVSANIHASVSGTVQKIDEVMDSTGYKRPTIIIQVEGDDWIEGIDLNSEIRREIKLNPEEIIKRVQDAGIVGLGGATFPAQVKLSIPKGKTAEYLLVNGAECEPYLTSDHRLMLERGEEILIGVQILMRALKVTQARVGIENNKPDAIQVLTGLAAKYNGIEIFPLKMLYPQGGERQLVKALVNREVPPAPAGLPIDVGCVVFNVGTVFAVYEAVQKNKPLIERVVSLTGPAVKKPSNFLVRIGTPILEMIQAAGGLPEDTGKVISGGPMMGRALNSLDIPVTKGMSGIVLLPRGESQRKEVLNCIRCAKCVSACPLGLEPYLLMTLAEKKFWDRAENEKILSCCECGCCSYICPANRPLLDYLRLGKLTVMKIIKSRKSHG